MPINEFISRTVILLFFSFLLNYIIPVESSALVYPETELKIFQFPQDMMPRIDGNPDDWKIVPQEYLYGTDMLLDVERDKPEGPMRLAKIDPKDLDIKVCFGWVKGMNCLYFLYEAYDNYWEFEDPGMKNDLFEICVDADLSGGDFVFSKFSEEEPEKRIIAEGSHAQNYHICTPAVNKSWAMLWNSPAWLNKLPWMNCAYSYNFKHSESGKLIMEGWITPFDYASFEGLDKSSVSNLKENRIIGLSWLIADWDEGKRHSLPSLSNDVLMTHDADYLRPFKLMPLEEKFIKEPLKANFTFEVSKADNRKVLFTDLSVGKISKWKWTFGDDTTSGEQNPVHIYTQNGGYMGAYTVTLEIEGPAGKSTYTALGEVILK